MQDIVLFGKIGEGSDKGWLIVGNNLNEGALAIKNVFKDLVGKDSTSLIVEHVEIRVI